LQSFAGENDCFGADGICAGVDGAIFGEAIGSILTAHGFRSGDHGKDAESGDGDVPVGGWIWASRANNASPGPER
jgi:hypothetical protein